MQKQEMARQCSSGRLRNQKRMHAIRFSSMALVTACCAFRRGVARESFRENLSKHFHFANCSDVQNARGRRELLVIKIWALNDAWLYQKHKKKQNKNKSEVFSVSEISFSSFLIDLGGATAKQQNWESWKNWTPITWRPSGALTHWTQRIVSSANYIVHRFYSVGGKKVTEVGRTQKLC